MNSDLKRICILFIVIFFFVSGVSFAAEKKSQFRDKEYGYSVDYPSSWIAGILRSGIVLSEVNSSDQKSGLQIRFMSSKKSLRSFVDAYNRGFIRDMKASLLDLSVVSINQRQGYAIRFKADGGSAYFLKSYVVPNKKGTGYYVFQAGTPFEKRGQVEPILDGIAFSFEE